VSSEVEKASASAAAQHPAVATEAIENLLLALGGKNRHECARSWDELHVIMHERAQSVKIRHVCPLAAP
jgi:hypothetical protein